MLKTLVISGAIALNFFIAPQALAEDNSNVKNQDISKQAWIESVEPILPNAICKAYFDEPQIKSMMVEANIDFDKCLPLIAKSVTFCKDKLLPSAPDEFNQSNLIEWNKKLGDCISEDYLGF